MEVCYEVCGQALKLYITVIFRGVGHGSSVRGQISALEYVYKCGMWWLEASTKASLCSLLLAVFESGVRVGAGRWRGCSL